MIRAIRFLLPGAAALLALLWAAELLIKPGDGGLPRMAAWPRAGLIRAEGQDPVGRWQRTILARPLFNADRRPPLQSTAAASSLARLSAIIIIGSDRRAVFAPKGRKPSILAKGGEIDGYRLVRIEPDFVTLAGPAGHVLVYPRFKNARTSEAPIAPPTPPLARPHSASLFSYDNE